MDDVPEPGHSEFASIARWLDPAPTHGPGILRGPGEDVAWLAAVGALAVSVDTFTQGVHFERPWLTDAQVGRKALAVALSDLAAARAHPVGCLVALSLPPDQLSERGDAVMAGLAEGARHWSCPVIGGDTSAGPVLSLSVTVVGRGTLFGRSGAAPGDLVQLSGPTGRAGAAVTAWLAGRDPAPNHRTAFVDARPRLDLHDALGAATAAIDVSDGLLADAAHLASASDCALVLDRAACATPGVPESLALAGGEDYELLATGPAPLPGFRTIGRVVAGAGLSFADGSPLPARRGWDHGDRR